MECQSVSIAEQGVGSMFWQQAGLVCIACVGYRQHPLERTCTVCYRPSICCHQTGLVVDPCLLREVRQVPTSIRVSDLRLLAGLALAGARHTTEIKNATEIDGWLGGYVNHPHT